MRNKESLIQMTSFISLLYVEAVEKDSRRKRDMIPEVFLFHAPESDDLQIRYVDQQHTVPRSPARSFSLRGELQLCLN